MLKQSPNPWYDRDIRSYQVDRQKKEEKRIFEEVLPGGQEVNVWKTERTAQGNHITYYVHITIKTDHTDCYPACSRRVRTFLDIFNSQ